MDVSVVVPVLNEEAGLAELHRRIGAALRDTTYEVVYVDDGSTDGSVALIERLGEETGTAVLVKLSRNFGMEVAMSAGIDHARGDFVALVHADLQDPPELLPDMLRIARDGADVVYARRIGRDEPWHKRLLATAFYKLMERLARVPYQGQAGDFRLMSRRVVDIVREMPESRRFLRGMVAWVGFDQVPVEYRRAGRLNGRGASYRSLFRLAAEAMAAFSDVPLAVASIAGMVTAALAGAAGVRARARDDLRLGDREPRRLDADHAALPRRRPADLGRHPRPLPGARARADAAAAAVPRRPRRGARPRTR